MSGLGWSNPSRAQTTAAQVLPAESKAVRVRIVNYKQSKVYEAIVPDGPAKLLEANPVDAQRDPIGELVAHLMEKRVALQRAAATLPSQGRWLRWACFSPDHQFVLAGMQDQATTAVTEAAVYKVSDMSVIMSIDSGRIIQDFKWSEDSKSLVVLESSEHMSKSPWGLLAALSGHPIELQTYFLRTVLVESRANSSLEITDNIENGEAELAR
ncbi:hypothetical protein [Dyella sp. 2HG41-7]|uniref:hypothetical protein n=1 Tax=Dyella sp. 2HG41-7 TaxID=2883239 RepID=UPI001F16A369|nr:hypothetical protein [Dyella sp. 2HG41-7]